MTVQPKVIAEYITQIREDIPGTCVHKRAENIVRCSNCKYFMIPKSEHEDSWCKKLACSVQPNGFCCWAKCRPYPIHIQ